MTANELLLSCPDASMVVRDHSNVVRIVPRGAQATLFEGDTVTFRQSSPELEQRTPVILGAMLDPTRTYRYVLWRIWEPSKKSAAFLMLNPSTADEAKDDPTIKRCIKFARSWGYGGIRVLNLFAFRSSHPRDLDTAENPEGDPDNRSFLRAECEKAGIVICAWGAHGKKRERAERVLSELRTVAALKLACLGLTLDGSPKHPLARGKHRIPDNQQPIPYIG